MKVLVTGAEGFLGKNLGVALGRRADLTVFGYDVNDRPDALNQALRELTRNRYSLEDIYVQVTRRPEEEET